jgi:hypothetical protein
MPERCPLAKVYYNQGKSRRHRPKKTASNAGDKRLIRGSQEVYIADFRRIVAWIIPLVDYGSRTSKVNRAGPKNLPDENVSDRSKDRPRPDGSDLLIRLIALARIFWNNRRVFLLQ